MTRIGVLALQGDFEAHARAYTALDVDTVEVRRVAQLQDIDGLVLPGGESTTLLKLMEDEPWFDALREFHDEGKAFFATCAGAILLAEKVENPAQDSLGLLHVTVRRNGYGRQLSSSVQTVEAEPELQIGPEAGTPLEAVLIRAPVILRAAPQVRVLARLHGQAVLVREGSVLAGTFHPELTSDSRVHRYFCGMIPEGDKVRNS